MPKTVEITTSQNVTIEYELASLRERALGYFLDLVIVMFAYGMFTAIVSAIFKGNNWWDALPVHVWVMILPLTIFFLYNILCEILNAGRTVGKLATNSKVVRLDGKDPEWGDVLMRAVMHLVDSIFSFGVFGALLIKTTDKSQRLGDMAAGTTVIKLTTAGSQFRLRDILNISSLDNYTPVYPQVRNLSEKDMIFIKTLLTRYQLYPNYAHEVAVEDLVTHLMPILGITQRPNSRVDFLKTLLRDYIVLTR